MVDLQCQKQTHLVIHLELLRKPPLQETSKVAHSIIKANHTERMKVYVEVGCRHVLIAVQDTIKCMDFIICLGDSLTRVTEKVNDRWEVSVSLSDGHFQQKKDANMKPHAVKNHMWVFINALIDNPAFNLQTKETLTTRQVNFGSKCELSPEFLKKVAKSGVVDNLLSCLDFKQNKELKKTDGTRIWGRISVIKKLEEANLAGKAKAGECTLILTEGDSAKALAKAGISVVGSNTYGVFPLRGKLLNVREAGH